VTFLGRNQPAVDDTTPRFTTVADEDGDLAVYDSHTGRFAPFLGDTALEVASDFNAGLDDLGRYTWKDTL
jgi:hypothetical protein